MSRFKVPAALVVIWAMSSLGVPAVAAPVTALSAAAKPMAQQGDLVRWHGWRGWHGGRFRCRPYCGWGG